VHVKNSTLYRITSYMTVNNLKSATYPDIWKSQVNLSPKISPPTHTFNGPFSRTTRVGRYQKGKINLHFTEARVSEWQWHQLGHILFKSSPLSRQITTPAPHHSVFYRPDALPATQPTASKHWRQKYPNCTVIVRNRFHCFADFGYINNVISNKKSSWL